MNCELVRGWASLLLLVGAAPITLAATSENPYLKIVDRNPFALRSAVVVTPPPQQQESPPSTPLIWLTGITDLPGRLTATLQYEDRLTHKVRYSALLAEGQGDDTLTVLHIDLVNAFVQVRCGGAETTLDFARNGVKPSATSPAPPVPPPFRAAAPNPSDRVIIGNPPEWAAAAPVAPKTGLTREQVEAIVEKRRQEFRALEASGQSTPARNNSIILPPTRPGSGGSLHP
jgi:hypothetical protein